MTLTTAQSEDRRHLVDELESALDAAGSGNVALSRRAVPRELLRPPTARGLLRMASEEWVMLVALWIAVASTPRWLYPVLLVGIAGRLHALGILLHDASHMPLRGKSIGVRLVEVLCGYPVASTIEAMRYHHLRHHRDSGMETDPYFKDGDQTPLWWTLNVLRGALLIPFWTARALVGAVASVAPTLRAPYARIFLQDKERADFERSPEVIASARAEWGQVVAQACVIACVVIWPVQMLLGYLLPVTLTGIVSARRVLVEHAYEHVTDRRMETILATTNDNHVSGWMGALLLAPRNVGYHVVHHLHPQVGLEHLPALRRWYREHHPALYPAPHR
jgi:fatty acid desaturase